MQLANDSAQTESPFEFVVHLGGSYHKLKGTSPGNGGGKRGRVTGFSDASRKRLQRKLASVNEGCVVAHRHFLTLTYPGQYPACGREWKRHLDTFIKRLMREYDVQALVWKLEPQKRLAPHYHLLVFASMPVDRSWVAFAWYDIVGSGRPEHLKAGTQCDRIKSWRGVLSYASKYLGKVVQSGDLPNFWCDAGRWWGVRGELPIEEITTCLTRQEGFKVRRVIRKMVERRCGIKITTWSIYSGLGCYVSDEDAFRLIGWAMKTCDDVKPGDDPPRPRDALDIDLEAMPY